MLSWLGCAHQLSLREPCCMSLVLLAHNSPSRRRHFVRTCIPTPLVLHGRYMYVGGHCVELQPMETCAFLRQITASRILLSLRHSFVQTKKNLQETDSSISSKFEAER